MLISSQDTLIEISRIMLDHRSGHWAQPNLQKPSKQISKKKNNLAINQCSSFIILFNSCFVPQNLMPLLEVNKWQNRKSTPGPTVCWSPLWGLLTLTIYCFTIYSNFHFHNDNHHLFFNWISNNFVKSYPPKIYIKPVLLFEKKTISDLNQPSTLNISNTLNNQHCCCPVS